MNILEKFFEKGINENIVYYGKGNLATGISVRNFLTEKEMILEHYTDCKIISLDDYIDYLFACYINKFSEIIDFVKEDSKEEFKKFYDNFKNIYNKYQIKEAIDFINKRFAEIYKYKVENRISYLDLDVKQQTTDFVAKYYKEINENVIDYILNNCFINVIDSFELWYKHLKNNTVNYRKFFKLDNIKEFFEVRSNDIYNALKDLKKNKKIEKEVDKTVEELYKLIKSKYCSPENEEVWVSYYKISDFYLFLLKIKSKYAQEFFDMTKKQKKQLDKEIIEKGQSFPIKIDLKPFIDFFKDETKPWEVRIIFITHCRNKDGILISFFDKAVKEAVVSLSDYLCKKNIGTNEYFTSPVLRSLDLYMFEVKARLLVIFEEENNLKEYFDDIFSEIKFIYSKMNIDVEEKKYGVLFDMLYKYINDIFNETEDNILNIIYGASSFICGLIEKILRDVFIDNTKEEYVLSSRITLGSLLNNYHSNCLSNIYSSDQLRCIRYYLGNDDGYKTIGLGLRNNIAHLNDDIIDRFDKDLVLTLMGLLTCIINSTTLYYQNNK